MNAFEIPRPAAVILLGALGVGVAPAQDSEGVGDPAPPKLVAVPKMKPPAPRAHPQVTVHGPPGPLSPEAVVSDWTQFLGSGGRGVSLETHLVKEWSDSGPRPVWELETGNGYAAPVVRGKRLIYFHRIGGEEVVECLHPETGQRYWDYRYATDYRDSFGYGNGPRCSPLVVGEYVYTYGAEGKLHCLKLTTGQLIWQRDLATEFEVPQDFFGVVSTPVLHKGHLVVHLGAPDGPCVIALDAKTGAMRWSADSKSNWLAGYSTPVLGEVNGQDRCFVFAGGKSRPPSGGLICLDPATGAIEFEFPWRSKSYESVNASSPVLVGSQVFVSATYDTGGALLDLKPNGGFEVAWTSEVLGTHFNTAIHDAGYLYGFDGRNEPDASLVCQELATGKEVWREVLEWEETYELHGKVKARPMSVYRGTLIAADADFLCLGERGHLLWLTLTPEGCRERARSWLFAAHETWTPPVLSHGLLYVCQNTRDFVSGQKPRLICYDLRK
ncbi:MAG: PQQ-binding-like beta-propeller repeat protein [bacterium]|nr:PQQ-binding-like beta-propeller repeat protein [bacterium]